VRDGHTERPFGRVATFPGGTEEQYRTVTDALGPAHLAAPGRLLLAAGPCSGGWQVVQLWSSRASFEDFVATHGRSARERAGERGFSVAPAIVDFAVVDLVRD
jgi:hypothetical protein